VKTSATSPPGYPKGRFAGCAPEGPALKCRLKFLFLDIFRWVGSGQLKIHVFGEYPLAEAAKAQAALEHRETIGKVLLIP
jgi:NADPH:quinone reductase-like Zn-dependent oxidoreductase